LKSEVSVYLDGICTKYCQEQMTYFLAAANKLSSSDVRPPSDLVSSNRFRMPSFIRATVRHRIHKLHLEHNETTESDPVKIFSKRMADLYYSSPPYYCTSINTCISIYLYVYRSV